MHETRLSTSTLTVYDHACPISTVAVLTANVTNVASEFMIGLKSRDQEADGV